MPPFSSGAHRPETGGKASGKGPRNCPIGRDNEFPYDRTDPDKMSGKPGAIGKGTNHGQLIPKDMHGPAWNNDYWSQADDAHEFDDGIDEAMGVPFNVNMAGRGNGGTGGTTPGTAGKSWAGGHNEEFIDDEDLMRAASKVDNISKAPTRGAQFGSGPNRMRGAMGPQRESIWDVIEILEARFPDEKFWNSDGSSKQPKILNKPPKGSVGTTSKDLGVGKKSLSQLFADFAKEHEKINSIEAYHDEDGTDDFLTKDLIEKAVKVAEEILYHEAFENFGMMLQIQDLNDTKKDPKKYHNLVDSILQVRQWAESKDLIEAFISLKSTPGQDMSPDSMDLTSMELDTLQGEFRNVFDRSLEIVSKMGSEDLFKLIIDLDPDFAAEKFAGGMDSGTLSDIYKTWGSGIGNLPNDEEVDPR